MSNMCSKESQELVTLAVDGLVDSAHEHDPRARYSAAQLAALRAATAMIADRLASDRAATVSAGPPSPQSPSPRSGATNVWQLLARLAPELSEWAALFHHTSKRRAAITTGTSSVSVREADDTLRDAASFVERVCRALGLPGRRLDASTQWLVAT